MQFGDRWTMDSTHQDRYRDVIVEKVISTMRERSRDGIVKYGTTLQDSPDGFYSWLNHLQEELMDAILYIEKMKNLNK